MVHKKVIRRLAYDDKDERLYDDPTIGGAITTRIGVTGCSWKVLEFWNKNIKDDKNYA